MRKNLNVSTTQERALGRGVETGVGNGMQQHSNVHVGTSNHMVPPLPPTALPETPDNKLLDELSFQLKPWKPILLRKSSTTAAATAPTAGGVATTNSGGKNNFVLELLADSSVSLEKLQQQFVLSSSSTSAWSFSFAKTYSCTGTGGGTAGNGDAPGGDQHQALTVVIAVLNKQSTSAANSSTTKMIPRTPVSRQEVRLWSNQNLWRKRGWLLIKQYRENAGFVNELLQLWETFYEKKVLQLHDIIDDDKDNARSTSHHALQLHWGSYEMCLLVLSFLRFENLIPDLRAASGGTSATPPTGFGLAGASNSDKIDGVCTAFDGNWSSVGSQSKEDAECRRRLDTIGSSASGLFCRLVRFLTRRAEQLSDNMKLNKGNKTRQIPLLSLDGDQEERQSPCLLAVADPFLPVHIDSDANMTHSGSTSAGMMLSSSSPSPLLNNKQESKKMILTCPIDDHEGFCSSNDEPAATDDQKSTSSKMNPKKLKHNFAVKFEKVLRETHKIVNGTDDIAKEKFFRVEMQLHSYVGLGGMNSALAMSKILSSSSSNSLSSNKDVQNSKSIPPAVPGLLPPAGSLVVGATSTTAAAPNYSKTSGSASPVKNLSKEERQPSKVASYDVFNPTSSTSSSTSVVVVPKMNGAPASSSSKEVVAAGGPLPVEVPALNSSTAGGLVPNSTSTVKNLSVMKPATSTSAAGQPQIPAAAPPAPVVTTSTVSSVLPPAAPAPQNNNKSSFGFDLELPSPMCSKLIAVQKTSSSENSSKNGSVQSSKNNSLQSSPRMLNNGSQLAQGAAQENHPEGTCSGATTLQLQPGGAPVQLPSNTTGAPEAPPSAGKANESTDVLHGAPNANNNPPASPTKAKLYVAPHLRRQQVGQNQQNSAGTAQSGTAGGVAGTTGNAEMLNSTTTSGQHQQQHTSYQAGPGAYSNFNPTPGHGHHNAQMMSCNYGASAYDQNNYHQHYNHHSYNTATSSTNTTTQNHHSYNTATSSQWQQREGTSHANNWHGSSYNHVNAGAQQHQHQNIYDQYDPAPPPGVQQVAGSPGAAAAQYYDHQQYSFNGLQQRPHAQQHQYEPENQKTQQAAAVHLPEQREASSITTATSRVEGAAPPPPVELLEEVATSVLAGPEIIVGNEEHKPQLSKQSSSSSENNSFSESFDLQGVIDKALVMGETTPKGSDVAARVGDEQTHRSAIQASLEKAIEEGVVARDQNEQDDQMNQADIIAETAPKNNVTATTGTAITSSPSSKEIFTSSSGYSTSNENGKEKEQMKKDREDGKKMPAGGATTATANIEIDVPAEDVYQVEDFSTTTHSAVVVAEAAADATSPVVVDHDTPTQALLPPLMPTMVDAGLQPHSPPAGAGGPPVTVSVTQQQQPPTTTTTSTTLVTPLPTSPLKPLTTEQTAEQKKCEDWMRAPSKHGYTDWVLRQLFPNDFNSGGSGRSSGGAGEVDSGEGGSINGDTALPKEESDVLTTEKMNKKSGLAHDDTVGTTADTTLLQHKPLVETPTEGNALEETQFGICVSPKKTERFRNMIAQEVDGGTTKVVPPSSCIPRHHSGTASLQAELSTSKASSSGSVEHQKLLLGGQAHEQGIMVMENEGLPTTTSSAAALLAPPGAVVGVPPTNNKTLNTPLASTANGVFRAFLQNAAEKAKQEQELQGVGSAENEDEVDPVMLGEEEYCAAEAAYVVPGQETTEEQQVAYLEDPHEQHVDHNYTTLDANQNSFSKNRIYQEFYPNATPPSAGNNNNSSSFVDHNPYQTKPSLAVTEFTPGASEHITQNTDQQMGLGITAAEETAYLNSNSPHFLVQDLVTAGVGGHSDPWVTGDQQYNLGDPHSSSDMEHQYGQHQGPGVDGNNYQHMVHYGDTTTNEEHLTTASGVPLTGNTNTSATTAVDLDQHPAHHLSTNVHDILSFDPMLILSPIEGQNSLLDPAVFAGTNFFEQGADQQHHATPGGAVAPPLAQVHNQTSAPAAISSGEEELITPTNSSSYYTASYKSSRGTNNSQQGGDSLSPSKNSSFNNMKNAMNGTPKQAVGGGNATTSSNSAAAPMNNVMHHPGLHQWGPAPGGSSHPPAGGPLPPPGVVTAMPPILPPTVAGTAVVPPVTAMLAGPPMMPPPNMMIPPPMMPPPPNMAPPPVLPPNLQHGQQHLVQHQNQQQFRHQHHADNIPTRRPRGHPHISRQPAVNDSGIAMSMTVGPEIRMVNSTRNHYRKAPASVPSHSSSSSNPSNISTPIKARSKDKQSVSSSGGHNSSSAPHHYNYMYAMSNASKVNSKNKLTGQPEPTLLQKRKQPSKREQKIMVFICNSRMLVDPFAVGNWLQERRGSKSSKSQSKSQSEEDGSSNSVKSSKLSCSEASSSKDHAEIGAVVQDNLMKNTTSTSEEEDGELMPTENELEQYATEFDEWLMMKQAEKPKSNSKSRWLPPEGAYQNLNEGGSSSGMNSGEVSELEEDVFTFQSDQPLPQREISTASSKNGPSSSSNGGAAYPPGMLPPGPVPDPHGTNPHLPKGSVWKTSSANAHELRGYDRVAHTAPGMDTDQQLQGNMNHASSSLGNNPKDLVEAATFAWVGENPPPGFQSQNSNKAVKSAGAGGFVPRNMMSTRQQLPGPTYPHPQGGNMGPTTYTRAKGGFP
ncbi:unnamed protein product [Amoebophrya sp. A120]|nr:unnamed protein product [Amoebophrya sp. A120]|eukprot:GSA120T00008896001.1